MSPEHLQRVLLSPVDLAMLHEGSKNTKVVVTWFPNEQKRTNKESSAEHAFFLDDREVKEHLRSIIEERLGVERVKSATFVLQDIVVKKTQAENGVGDGGGYDNHYGTLFLGSADTAFDTLKSYPLAGRLHIAIDAFEKD